MPEAPPGEITRLLSEIQGGNPNAADRLVPIVYRELRRIAAGIMARERPGHTLQPTAVVHEAWLRLIQGRPVGAENRAHFFAIAAKAMRNVLVDHARRKLADKRGGELQQRVEIEDHLALTEQQSAEVLSLHEGLERLKALDPRQAEIMEMHYFAGESVEEIAAALHLSERTVKRELQTGRLFLKDQLTSPR